jgi:transposase
MGREGCFNFWDLDPVLKTSPPTARKQGCVLNAYGKMSLRGFLASAHIRPGNNMVTQKNKVCGVDIHKKFLIATILSREGTKIQKRYSTDIDDLLNFRDWVLENDCECVAIESTGVYWYPVNAVLENKVELVLANAYQIKHIPGRKTDLIDSEWIAELALSNLIDPSRIFQKDERDLRRLTRTREGLVKIRSQIKNQVHQGLESCSIKLSSVLSDNFGKSGRHILEGLIKGENIDRIIEEIPSKRVKKNEDQIRAAIRTGLDETQIFLIQSHLNTIDGLTRKLDEIESKIKQGISGRKEDLAIAMSVPGIGFKAATTILAEIGNYRDFSTPDKLASWCGIVPNVYQSADKLITGCITKQGSKHIRWILVQVAQAALKKRGSKLRKFFLRIKTRKGHNVAVVARARKILCILHHLLMNQEMYQEDGVTKSRQSRIDWSSDGIDKMSLQTMIKIIGEAGYEVRKIERYGG